MKLHMLLLALVTTLTSGSAKGQGAKPAITVGDDFVVVNKAPYRAGYDSSSDKAGTLAVGTVVTAVEARPNANGGEQMRIKQNCGLF